MKNQDFFLASLRTRNLNLKSFFLLVFLFVASLGYGQTDACTTPPVLTVGTTCTTTSFNVLSTFTNSGVPICTGTSHRDGWYQFTTNATTTLITIEGTSNSRLGLALYRNTCATPIQVACKIGRAHV